MPNNASPRHNYDIKTDTSQQLFPRRTFLGALNHNKRFKWATQEQVHFHKLKHYQKILHQHDIRAVLTPYSIIGSFYEKHLGQNPLRRPSSAGDGDRTYVGQKNHQINERIRELNIVVERDIILRRSQTRRAANSNQTREWRRLTGKHRITRYSSVR